MAKRECSISLEITADNMSNIADFESTANYLLQQALKSLIPVAGDFATVAKSTKVGSLNIDLILT